MTFSRDWEEQAQLARVGADAGHGVYVVVAYTVPVAATRRRATDAARDCR